MPVRSIVISRFSTVSPQLLREERVTVEHREVREAQRAIGFLKQQGQRRGIESEHGL